MEGEAGEFHAVFEGLALRFEDGEGGEQRRMDRQAVVWKFGDKKGREQTHVTREADEVDFVLVENGGDLAVVDFALKAFRRNHASGDSARFRALDARGAFAIANDDGDFGVRNAACRDAIRQRLEGLAAAAYEHTHSLL